MASASDNGVLPRHSPWFSPVEKIKSFLPNRMRCECHTDGVFGMFDVLTVVVQKSGVFLVIRNSKASPPTTRKVKIRHGRFEYGVPYFSVNAQSSTFNQRCVVVPVSTSSYFSGHNRKMRDVAKELYRDVDINRKMYDKVVRDWWRIRVGRKYEMTLGTATETVQVVEPGKYDLALVKTCDAEETEWSPVTWIDDDTGDVMMAARGSTPSHSDFPIMLTPVDIDQ